MTDFKAIGEAFTKIYDTNAWGDGSGSAAEPTRPYAEMLARLLRDNAITSVVDVGCGDWAFSKEMDWSGIRYRGFDVVESVIAANKSKFGADGITFQTLRAISDLPPADLVVCKDVLQHLPNKDVNQYLDYFLAKYKFALVTNDIYPDKYTNVDITYGQGRAIRLDRPPFNRKIAVLLRWKIEHLDFRVIKDTCLLMRRA